MRDAAQRVDRRRAINATPAAGHHCPRPPRGRPGPPIRRAAASRSCSTTAGFGRERGGPGLDQIVDRPPLGQQLPDRRAGARQRDDVVGARREEDHGVEGPAPQHVGAAPDPDGHGAASSLSPSRSPCSGCMVTPSSNPSLPSSRTTRTVSASTMSYGRSSSSLISAASSAHGSVAVEAGPQQRRGVVEVVEAIRVFVEQHRFAVELDRVHAMRRARHEVGVERRRIAISHRGLRPSSSSTIVHAASRSPTASR